MKIETIKIIREDHPYGYVVINKDKFIEGVHHRYKEREDDAVRQEEKAENTETEKTVKKKRVKKAKSKE